MSDLTLQKNLLPEHYSGKYKGSFAYLTIKDRLPVILVKVVDFLCQNKKDLVVSYGEVAKEEIKEIIGKLSALQNEMITNKTIKPLICDVPDVTVWNDYLEKQEKIYGFPPAWFESPWLYVECYFYRRIKQTFQFSTVLKEFDPFHKQKENSFLSLMDAVLFLCSALNETLAELKNSNGTTDLFKFFRTYLEISLWGNKCDLSISAGMESIQQNNPLTQLDEFRENIIVNDTETLWQILQDLNKFSKDVSIDIILDNAGFELFCDLCLLHFLQEAKLVKKVQLHVKMMPWFVSDTLEKDIHWLLKTLLQSNHKILVNFSKDCSNKIISGEWNIVNEPFWTYPHDYSEMKTVAPVLYEQLSKSDVLIFKGDLNYRKLTGDRQWNETTSFKESLNGFLPTSLVTLRTVKADVIVGLRPGTSNRIAQISENWKFKGDFAVIQCYKKSNLI
ncbi:damage-control phosphatase ARMT1 [Trichonephila inaurata madagascariensis]|uniref:Sugar phosphate phosphatase n=1 Tax=Trichonephila inaurata madagascariensis TaxID=2747483 RepID=A0A8X6XLR8_9ARAC|nr:damage-control phosphatase ARMT1 [Trichonephila inaurata madagascariensis]